MKVKAWSVCMRKGRVMCSGGRSRGVDFRSTII